MRAQDMKSAKKEMRRRVEAAIARLSGIERFERSARAQLGLMRTPEFAAGRTLLLYHTKPGEVETHFLMIASLFEGRRVALPRTDPATHRMAALEVRSIADDLERGPYGALEPLARLPAVPADQIDLVVVPGRAFDPRGQRLGRGAGFYDRFLSSEGFRGTAVALAFDCQILDEIPHLPHDVPVHMIVTETRVIRCAATTGGQGPG